MTPRLAEVRDRVAALLSPASVAIVGTSPSGGYGGSAHLNLQRFGYNGRLYSVNPKYQEVFGNPSFARLADLPEVVDCVVVGVAAKAALEIVEDAARLGVRNVVLLASGFAESDDEGQQLQRRLAAVAGEAGVSVCGPNCLGFINLAAGIVPFAGGIPAELTRGSLAIVSQSGGISTELTSCFQSRSVGLSYVVSSGNGAVTTIEDYIAFLAQSPEVGVIALVVEGFRKPRLLVEALELAAAAGKPVVALKLGASPQGARQVASHTGALAGDDRVIDALFERWGVARVVNLDDLIETAICLTVAARPTRMKIAVVTGSGGRASLSADLSSSVGLELADYAPATREQLEALLPPFATISNPLDVTGPVYQQDDNYVALMRTVAEDPDVGLLAVYQSAAKSTGPSPKHKDRNLRLAGLVADAAHAVDTPVVAFTTTVGGEIDLALARLLHERGVPLLLGGDRAMRAIASLMSYQQFRAPLRVKRLDGIDVPSELVSRLRREAGLSEFSSKELLRAHGIPVSRGQLVGSVEEALAAAGELGYPVAVKAVSPQVAHKTRFGLVALDVRDGDALRAAYLDLSSRAKSLPVSIEGILVEEMTQAGLEVLLGARNSEFGPLILFGAGGVLTEVASDTAVALGPVDLEGAERLLARTRIGRLILADVGSSAGLSALLAAIVAFSDLTLALGDAFIEIDLNPLIVTAGSAIAVDALVR
jgi:acetate---CoA ligase (ADP-forming)